MSKILMGPIELMLDSVFYIARRYTDGHIGVSLLVLSMVSALLAFIVHVGTDRSIGTVEGRSDKSKGFLIRRLVILILHVLFFVAAYRFFSKLHILIEHPLFMMGDLSVPDHLWVIGDHPINVLPIIMLVAGIVTILISSVGSSRIMRIISLGFIFALSVSVYNVPSGMLVWMIMSTCIYAGICLLRLVTYKVFRKKEDIEKKQINDVGDGEYRPKYLILLICGAFLTVLTGCLIPSTVISSSTSDFINSYNVNNPLLYIVQSLMIALGTFIVWCGAIYYVLGSNGRRTMNRSLCALCGVAMADWFFFGAKLGTISSELQYNKEPEFSVVMLIINTIAVLLAIAIFILIHDKKTELIKVILLAECLMFVVMTATNSVKIYSEYTEAKNIAGSSSDQDEVAAIPLSKEGHNVIIFFLDRAMGPYVPYILNERPEIAEKFDGFTYYPNTVSFGGYTNFGSPAIYGGYEYSPWEMNKREDELIGDKHNEALKVLPEIFASNGYEVTVTDPPYAGYGVSEDLSIYDDCSGVNAYQLYGTLDTRSPEIAEGKKHIRNRNFFCYSLMRISPLSLWNLLYSDGRYNENNSVFVQSRVGSTIGYGYDMGFLENYMMLEMLNDLTDIREEPEDTFTIIYNQTPHEPCLLQEPDYTLQLNVDNTDYDVDMEDRYTLDGKTMKMDISMQKRHYHANISSLIRLGEWFDYLRENGIYDNTRIIVVADHGRDIGQFDDLILEDGTDVQLFTPLLMMKDFDAHGFNRSDEFMTNADGAVFAVRDIISDPVNPYTGNLIDDSYKYTEDIHVIASHEYNVTLNNGYRFNKSRWYTVKDNIYDRTNWNYIGEY